jgi:RNA polymerase sigma-70 factor, ECF subfamily
VPDPRHDADDHTLLAAARRGDADAFGALYQRHRDWAWRIALRFCPDEAAARDVTHDVFVDLLVRLPRLELRGRLTTYLYPAIKHASLTRARRDRRLRFGLAPVERAAEPPTPRALDGLDPDLHAALAALPESQRETLLMRVVDDMTPPEIALALAIPVGTVKSRVHNALQALREDPRLGTHGPGPCHRGRVEGGQGAGEPPQEP